MKVLTHLTVFTMKTDFRTRLSLFKEELANQREENELPVWTLGITLADAIFKYQAVFESHQEALQAIDYLLQYDPEHFERGEDYDEEGVVVYAKDKDW